MKNKKWIDISQPLNNHIAHWPGDTSFRYELAFTKSQTGSVNIGKITTSLHTGTHVDAPFHFDNYGKKILSLELDIFVGPARVIDVTEYEYIDAAILERFDLQGAERVLLKTSISSEPSRFPDEVPTLSADIAECLSNYGICLLGIDAPSVDSLKSKNMPVHHALHKFGIHILENIMLDTVNGGTYELIALPLPLVEADGSPVRAVLRPID